MKNVMSHSYLRGTVSAMLSWNALMSFFQDYIGVDAYVEMVRKHWCPTTVTVPFAVALLVASVGVSFWQAWEELKEEKKNEDRG